MSKTVRAPRYLGWWEARFLRPLRRPPHVAIVELQGTIAPGRKAERTIAVSPRSQLRNLSLKIRQLALQLLQLEAPPPLINGC